MQLELEVGDFAQRAVSPFLELGAYESLWDEQNASFKSLASLFAKQAGALPSDFVERARASSYANDVHRRLKDAGVDNYGVRVYGAGDYPERLRIADHPVQLLYFQGWWDLVNSPRSVAVVGTRKPTSEGLARTRKLVKALLQDNFTIVSGLAAGVDTAAQFAGTVLVRPDACVFASCDGHTTMFICMTWIAGNQTACTACASAPSHSRCSGTFCSWIKTRLRMARSGASAACQVHRWVVKGVTGMRLASRTRAMQCLYEFRTQRCVVLQTAGKCLGIHPLITAPVFAQQQT